MPSTISYPHVMTWILPFFSFYSQVITCGSSLQKVRWIAFLYLKPYIIYKGWSYIYYEMHTSTYFIWCANGRIAWLILRYCVLVHVTLIGTMTLDHLGTLLVKVLHVFGRTCKLLGIHSIYVHCWCLKLIEPGKHWQGTITLEFHPNISNTLVTWTTKWLGLVPWGFNSL